MTDILLIAQSIASFIGSNIASIAQIILGVATIIIGYFTYTANKKLADIEERRDADKALETKKALIIPDFLHIGEERNGKDVIMLKNYGKGIARNVKIEFDGKKISQIKSFVDQPEIIPYIAPGSHYNYIYVAYIEDTENHEVTVIWDDDIKSGNKIKTWISIF